MISRLWHDLITLPSQGDHNLIFYLYLNRYIRCMRSFLMLILLIGALWAIDAIAFGGEYSTAIWQEANYQGQKLNYELQYTFRKLGL